MTVLKLFFLFCYFGLLAFGGGNALTPIYIDKLVNAWQWITLEEFGNLLAISQMTPGPIGVNAATFLGYRQAGIPGALAATIGLVAPSYFLVILVMRSLKKWENSRIVQGLMCGVRPATIGLISAALLIFMEMSVFSGAIPWHEWFRYLTGSAEKITGDFHIRLPALLIFIAAAALLYRTRISIMAVIFAAALAGALFC